MKLENVSLQELLDLKRIELKRWKSVERRVLHNSEFLQFGIDLASVEAQQEQRLI